jgi:carbon storage regulator
MLVLEREIGERILIGDDIVIEVCAVRCRTSPHVSVRIGITAPGLEVDREEIRKAKRENPREAP